MLHESDKDQATIITSGIMVDESLKAYEALQAEGISVRVIDMFTWKPLDEELVVKAARECGKIITCEEHSVIGGLGEAVCACLSEQCPVPVRRIGVNDEFGHSGPAADLLKQFGLSAEHIVEVAKGLLRQISGRRPPCSPSGQGAFIGQKYNYRQIVIIAP